MTIYRSVRFSDGGPNVDAEAIGSLEKIVRAKLPNSYRDFLLTTNGGCPRPSGFKLKSDDVPAPGANFDTREQMIENLQYLSGERRTGLEREIEFYDNAYVPPRITRLFGLNTTDHISLDEICGHVGRARLYRPQKVLVIGADETDANVCLMLKGPYRHGVAVLEPNPAPGEPYEHEDVEDGLIADSFEEFIDGLFSARVLLAEGYTPPSEIMMAVSAADREED